MAVDNLSNTVVDTSRLYPSRPLPGVGAVVLRGDEVLMIQRGKPPRLGQWSLPGGLHEVGETAEAAVIREVMEETGIAIRVERLIDHVNVIQHDDDGRVKVHYLLLDFLAVPVGGRLQAGDDAADARWVPVADVDGMGLWEETRRMIHRGAELLR
ncbi:MAG: NUDIX hydrolase [Alphaproteobacteria bacterium]